jgi:hypothetical protein
VVEEEAKEEIIVKGVHGVDSALKIQKPINLSSGDTPPFMELGVSLLWIVS